MRNTGVTVSLVVFMGLSGALGGATYIGAKGASEAKQQTAALKQESSELQSVKSKTQSDFTTLKERLGYPAVESAEELSKAMDDDVKSVLGSVDLNTSYRDAILALGRANKREAQGKKASKRMNDAALEIADMHKDMNATQQKTYGANLDDVKATHAETLADARSSFDKLNDEFNAQADALGQLEKETKTEIDAKKQETADFQEIAGNLQKINRSLVDRVEEIGNIEFERADASILFADQVTRLVHLDVGAKDGVQPMTTFNVFPPDSLDMAKDRAKGSVQVVRTLSDHVSVAKILEDEMSNPVMAGDLVYTPLWRRGKPIRYALDYKLDVDGDGLSDLDKIVGLIRSSGAEVAAWINDKGEVEGEITDDVYRLVRANENVSDVVERDSTLNEEEREKLVKLEADFLQSAKDKGVEEIFLSDFLVSIGYKETAKLTRYREKGGVDLQDNGTPTPDPTTNPVAPIYQIDPDHAPVSPGIIAPVFRKDAEPAPVSDGKVSDYYTRQRNSKSE